MADLLVGADIGTSACKVSLLRADDGQVLASALERYMPSSPKPGWMEQDPDRWVHALHRSVRRILGGTPDAAASVRAIGIAGQMRGVVLVDRHGKPARDAILWNDNRCHAEVAALGDDDVERLRAITRNPVNTMCTLPKLQWLRRHERDALDGTTLLYPKDYVRLVLTGALATDHSDASGSSLYDARAQAWSGELLERFGIEPSLLPPISRAIDRAGNLTLQAASAMTLPAGIPVIVGGSDSTVESYAVGLTDERSCKVRLGTSGAVSTVVADIEDTGSAYVWSFLTSGRWMLDTNTRSCGQAVRWLRDTAYREFDDDDEAFAAIDREAAVVDPGADGLLFHPYLLGEDAPYWDPTLQAAFTGLGLSHSRGHLARAVLEGTVFALRDAMSTLGGRVAGLGRVVFVGGGTLSPTWISIVADVLSMDGELPAAADASLGAAMLAGVGTGVFTDLEQGLVRCYRVRARVVHGPERAETYDQAFERYLALRPQGARA